MKNFKDLDDPRFVDFKVLIRWREEGEYEVQVLDSPVGLADGLLLQPPTMEEAEAWFEELRSAHKEYLESRGTGDARVELERAQRKIGVRLRKLLFSSEIANCFGKTEVYVDHLAKMGRVDGLRFHLCFDPTDPGILHLAALPWELMLHPEKGEPLFGERDRWLVRYFETREVIAGLEVEDELRVLLVASEPELENVPSLDLEGEARRVEEALGKIDCRVELYSQPTLSGLSRRLREGKHHVLHFMGHGYFRSESGTGLLGFVEEEGRDQLEVVSGPILARQLASAAHHLKLVVLNTCYGGALPRRAEHPAFAGVSSALLAAGVPAVVAMQLAISDPAAVEFSKAFYGALAERRWVEAAVTCGRHALMAASGARLEWATPVLFLRGRKGDLFGPPFRQLPAVQHVGIRSFVEGFRAHMSESCKPILELGGYFDPGTERRKITDPSLWNSAIAPKVAAFAREIDERRPVLFELAAHTSIAFLAGRELQTKGGLDFEILQRGRRGEEKWNPNEGEVPEEPLWMVGERVELDPTTSAVALAVGVTKSVLADVELYVRDQGLPVRSIVPMEIVPGAGQASVLSGAHAVALADGVVDLVHGLRTEERITELHLFMAAPHSFAFFLGQLSWHLGAVQLYEHGFGAGPGAYAPSITIEALPWP